ncbi:MAG: tyrosine-type recombinase/integrase [Eubacteriales bacterium]|nr:tyrosine-type recombinase/integrase [Eubacteriales bacterium]
MSDHNTPFSPDYVSSHFSLLLKNNHLPHIRFHDLRHTAGSMLVNQGHTIKQVQEFLGHEKASTTLDIYTHVSMEGKKDTADVLDLLLA